MKTKKTYRAIVYLTQSVDIGNIKGTPCFYTRSNEDKNVVYAFVKTLHEQNIIQAYRMCYSPEGDENQWYMDSEVVYFESSGPIICGIYK